jgi:hypothetical protein
MVRLAAWCLQEKAQAQSFANALATIGKFVIKKKTGDKDQIYGSVQVGSRGISQWLRLGASLLFSLLDFHAPLHAANW